MTAGRALVRSLNILLKFARLYGYDHARTTEQLNIAFQELRTAVPVGSDTALLLGATGAQLLLDGVPLEVHPLKSSSRSCSPLPGSPACSFLPRLQKRS